MKKRTQKMVLSRETILLLGSEVRLAVGGVSISCSPCYTDNFTVCVTTTNTNSDTCPSVSCLKQCSPLPGD